MEGQISDLTALVQSLTNIMLVTSQRLTALEASSSPISNLELSATPANTQNIATPSNDIEVTATPAVTQNIITPNIVQPPVQETPAIQPQHSSQSQTSASVQRTGVNFSLSLILRSSVLPKLVQVYDPCTKLSSEVYKSQLDQLTEYLIQILHDAMNGLIQEEAVIRQIVFPITRALQLLIANIENDWSSIDKISTKIESAAKKISKKFLPRFWRALEQNGDEKPLSFLLLKKAQHLAEKMKKTKAPRNNQNYAHHRGSNQNSSHNSTSNGMSRGRGGRGGFHQPAQASSQTQLFRLNAEGNYVPA